MHLKTITANKTIQAQRAFTLVELLVVIGVVALILGLIPCSFSGNVKTKAVRIKCSSSLKQVALSFKMFAGDNDEKMPWEVYAEQNPESQRQQVWQYFQAISNELGSAKILMCPGDVARQPNSSSDFTDGADGLANSNRQNLAVSYFLGTSVSSNQPNAILTGDRNLSPDGKPRLYTSRLAHPTMVATNTIWNAEPNQAHHDNAGNYALADGSVQQATTDRLQDALKLARNSYGTNANRFLFPQ